MNTALIIGMVILTGVSIGWVFHHRSMRHMKPILTRLAAEKNGTVESSSLFLMPRLRFSHSDTEVEVSSASTGIAGESVHYTYAVFKGLDLKSFEFRILPKSLQTIGDNRINDIGNYDDNLIFAVTGIATNVGTVGASRAAAKRPSERFVR